MDNQGDTSIKPCVVVYPDGKFYFHEDIPIETIVYYLEYVKLRLVLDKSFERMEQEI